MSIYTKVAAAAVVAIAVGAIVLWQLPRHRTTEANPDIDPDPSANRLAAPGADGGVHLEHARHLDRIPLGLGGDARRLRPGRHRRCLSFGETSGDLIYDPARADHLFLVIASQPLAGAAGSAWADTIGLAEACPSSEPIVVDDAEGRLITCDPMRALFWSDDRGYLVLLYRSPDEPWLHDAYDAAWFQEVLATVQIAPADVGTADTFVRPFDYVLPGAPVFDYGATEATYWEVRVPAYNDAGNPGGLIVQAIGGGRVDPCDGESATLPLDPGPDSVIEYLKTIPELTVTDESDTTVDGRPARQATVTATAGGADCPGLWVWVEEGESFITDVALRLVAVDVDGEQIVVTIFGEEENPELPDLADAIIGSFRFAATG